MHTRKSTAKRNGLFISAGLILAAGFAYMFSQHPNSQAAGSSVNTSQVTASGASPAGYTNGTYTGSSADAYYGTVQVKAIIQGGKLTDVQFLQYPNEHGTSVYINSQAMPILRSEAIQAQSANVSGVSGASATSQAFIQSLASALSQAQG